jgi:hypothetical protein
MAYAKMTKKAVMDFFPTTICIYYCEAQHLLSGLDPNASVYGDMGKNADVYCISPTVAIVTGARAFGNFRPDYKTVKAFEERAEDICRKYAWSGERDVELKKLREEFIQSTVYDRSTHTYKTVAGEKAEIECISDAWYVFTRRDDEDDTVLCAECDSFAEAEIELHRIRPKAKKIA